jgi:GNAT superfamily N-acetyltransferase
VETRCELAEAAAFSGMWDCLGLPLLRVAGATCLALPDARGDTLLNRVIAVGASEPAGDDVLDEIDRFYREAEVPRYSISVAPGPGAELEERLRRRGFSPGYPWMRFRRGVHEPPEAASELRVAEAADGETFGRIVAAGFGLPPEAGAGLAAVAGRPGWHLFLALAGDEPAAAAALFVHEGVGWFGAAATLPEHRRRGAQNALLAARIRRAAELGLEALTVETGENVPERPSGSYRNILRAGFEEWYLRPNLLSPE